MWMIWQGVSSTSLLMTPNWDGWLRDHDRLEKGANRNLTNFNEGKCKALLLQRNKPTCQYNFEEKALRVLAHIKMDRSQQCVFVAKGLMVSWGQGSWSFPLFSTGEITAGALYPVLGSLLQETLTCWKESSEQTLRWWRDWSLSPARKSWESWDSSAKKSLRRLLINVYKYQKSRYKKDRAQLFSVVPRDRTRVPRHILKCRRCCCVSIREQFFAVRVTAWAQAARGGYGVSLLGDTQKLPGHGPGQTAQGGPPWARGLGLQGSFLWFCIFLMLYKSLTKVTMQTQKMITTPVTTHIHRALTLLTNTATMSTTSIATKHQLFYSMRRCRWRERNLNLCSSVTYAATKWSFLLHHNLIPAGGGSSPCCCSSCDFIWTPCIADSYYKACWRLMYHNNVKEHTVQWVRQQVNMRGGSQRRDWHDAHLSKLLLHVLLIRYYCLGEMHGPYFSTISPSAQKENSLK